MPTLEEVELIIPHVPVDVFARLKRTADSRGQTIEQFALAQLEQAATGPSVPFDAESWLARREAELETIAQRPSALRPGESLKDMAREGLRDA